MKSHFHKIIVILVFVWSCLSYGQITKAEIRTTGLTCSMCTNSIKKSLQALPNVTEITTDLNTNTFTVFLKNPNTTTPKNLKNSIENAGFSVGKMTLEVSDTELHSNRYNFLNKAPTQKTNKIEVLNAGYVTQKEFKKLKKIYTVLDSGFDTDGVYHVKWLQ